MSYAHADLKFARRLHKALETYRVPKNFVGQAQVQKDRGIGRIFRDEDELGGAESLGAALEGAIDDSANLLVIASPKSAASGWVDKEVQRFKRRGDGTKVFAVIVDGKPHSLDDNEECFCPSLKVKFKPDGTATSLQDEPLAPDIRKEPFNKLVVRLVAALINVDFDALWRRQMRATRQRFIIGAVVLVIAGACVAGAIQFGLQTRIKTEVERNVTSRLQGAVKTATADMARHTKLDQASIVPSQQFEAMLFEWGGIWTDERFEQVTDIIIAAMETAPNANEVDRYIPERADALIRSTGLILIPEKIMLATGNDFKSKIGKDEFGVLHGPIPWSRLVSDKDCDAIQTDSDGTSLLAACTKIGENFFGEVSVFSIEPAKGKAAIAHNVYADRPRGDLKFYRGKPKKDDSNEIAPPVQRIKEPNNLVSSYTINADGTTYAVDTYGRGRFQDQNGKRLIVQFPVRAETIDRREFEPATAHKNGFWLIQSSPSTIWLVSDDELTRARQSEAIIQVCRNALHLEPSTLNQMYGGYLMLSDGFAFVTKIASKCRAKGYS